MARHNSGNSAALGFEKKLWDMADQMRGHMDPAEYKHVVLGLTFLKYISELNKHRLGQLIDTVRKTCQT